MSSILQQEIRSHVSRIDRDRRWAAFQKAIRSLDLTPAEVYHRTLELFSYAVPPEEIQESLEEICEPQEISTASAAAEEPEVPSPIKPGSTFPGAAVFD